MLQELKTSSPLIQERVVDTYFQRDKDHLCPNAILVDMEPKVINRCIQQEYKTSDGFVKWRFDPNNTVYRQGGSGNNWALGYQYFHDPEIQSLSQNLIRKQLERLDCFTGFQIFQSLAGGTGSGLGAHLVERLRDDYPGSTILNFSVWPYTNGEVILQNYNILLTLSHLLEHSDGVVTIFNDQILTICKELLKNPKPSFKILNQVIS